MHENSAEMFSDFDALKNVDLNGLDSSKVASMRMMFSSSNNLETIDFGDSWNTSNVTDMNGMFA